MRINVNNLSPSRERAVIITQTPMRVTLAGGGTDVNWYSNSHGGAWISASFNRYLVVTLTMTEDPNFVGYSYGQEATQGNSYKEIPNPFVKACLEHSGIVKGISVNISSEVSGKSGLGGSAALEVGLLNALYCFKKKSVSQLLLAKQAFEIESITLGRDYIGPQDQYIVSLGGIKYFERDKSGRVFVKSLPLSTDTIAELESSLLFFRTGIYRDAKTVLKNEQETIDEKKIQALDQIKALGQKAKSYLLKSDVDSFGSTLDEHWRIKKSLSKKVSNSKIDHWYKQAISAGALGGKIMGAGGGGWFVFYVNKDKSNFRQKMGRLGLRECRVRFDFEGTKVLVNLS